MDIEIKKQSCKILPIGKPLLRNGQDYAFPSAAMYSDEDYKNWVYSNSIQLYYDKSLKNPFAYFYNGISTNPLAFIPIFQRQYIKSHTIKKMNIPIIEYIKCMLDDDYYFTTSVNEYYIPNKFSYNRQNFNHGIMIYGYCDEKKVLYSAGYDISRYFRTQEISYEQFTNAFITVTKNIGCQSFKRNNMHYLFDIELVKQLLFDYINSYNTSKRIRQINNPREDFVFGIEACKMILTKNSNQYDIRSFYTFFEHKKTMLDRMRILLSNDIELMNHFINKYQIVTENSKLLLNLSIKANVRENFKIDKKIKELLLTILNIETEIIQELISVLNDSTANSCK